MEEFSPAICVLRAARSARVLCGFFLITHILKMEAY